MAMGASVMSSTVEEGRLPFREQEWPAWLMLLPLQRLLHHLAPRLSQPQLCGQRVIAVQVML